MPEIFFDALRALVAVLALAIAAEGFWRSRLGTPTRAALAIGALLLISSNLVSLALGAGLVAFGVWTLRSPRASLTELGKDH